MQNITNYVAMTISANVLLALGASPAMVHAREEVEDFVAISSSLAINVGTLSPHWVEAMKQRRGEGQCAWQAVGARPGRLRGDALPHGRGGGTCRAEANHHPRQCQRDHEPCRRRRGRRQGRQFDRRLRCGAGRGQVTGAPDRRRRRGDRRHRLRHRRRYGRRRRRWRCNDAALHRARLRAHRHRRRLRRRAPAASRRRLPRSPSMARPARRPPAAAAAPATCRRNCATRST